MESDEANKCDEKLTFQSQSEAEGSAVVAKMRYGTELTPYLCQKCGLWHLTSN